MKTRPNINDYDTYFDTYVSKVGEDGFLDALNSNSFLNLLHSLSIEQWNHRYAEGKWNVKEVLMHIMDTERIFSYRALRISRNDKRDLHGFDQDDYVPFYESELRSPSSLISEYEAVRAATLALFQNFNANHLSAQGIASGAKVSVLALGYMIAGHEIHHQDILVNKYLTTNHG